MKIVESKYGQKTVIIVTFQLLLLSITKKTYKSVRRGEQCP